MKILANIATLAVLLVPAFARAPATTATVRTKIVSYPSGQEIVHGYLALPTKPAGAGSHAQSSRRPAVIVVHGDHGLNDWTKDQARKLSARGYVVLAVDLYRGEIAQNDEAAHELMRGMPDDRALRDLEAAFTYLAARPDVRKTKIGVIGWNMGGWYALQLAIHQPALAACVVSDSALPTDRADIAHIRAPVLGNFGADNRGIPPEALRAFELATKSAGETADLKAYPGASDDFDDPSNADRYRPDAATDAWNRTLAFFAKALGP
jgi:carboxymethylenebutenolidase